MDGDRGDALEHLGHAAEIASANDLASLGAAIHFDMAMVEAMLGSADRVAPHVTAGQAVAGFPVLPRHGLAAMAYAFAGMTTEARAAITQLEQSDPTPFWESVAHQATAMVMLQSDDVEGAVAAIGQANPAQWMTHAVLADAYAAQDYDSGADALRAGLVHNRRFTFMSGFNPTAVTWAKRQR